MENSKLGFIYKIVNTENTDFYIGSTSGTLKIRLKTHFYSIDKKPNIKLYKLMMDLGKDKFNIELVENVIYSNIEELRKKEQEYIERLKPSLNSINAFGKDKEKIRLNQKRKYDKHKEKTRIKHKENYELNKEKILLRVHKYAEEHKEEIKERGIKYREKNKETIKARKSKKEICECGTEYTHDHKSRHLRSKFHLNFIENKLI